MARRNLRGLRLLVTGASQGIGRALAVEAATRGCQVVATARSAELLDQLAIEIRASGGTIEPLVGDVTNADDRLAMYNGVLKQFGGLDVLINNAGIGATGHFMESQPETLRQIFETNYFGTVEMIRTFLPLLKAGNQPAIVNISSVLGRRAWPARSLYSASKFAVQGFSDAIRAELSKDNIDVIVVSPGLTQTNFSHNMLERSARIPLDHLRGMTSEAVAKATLDALEAGKAEVVLTARGKLLMVINRLIPGLIDRIGKRKIRKLFADEIAARKQQNL